MHTNNGDSDNWDPDEAEFYRELDSGSRNAPIMAAAVAFLVAVTGWAMFPLFNSDSSDRTAADQSGFRVNPSGVYNPVTAGEPLPDGFRQLLPRDAILPVYEPVFVAADTIEWDDEVDVIGVEIDGEAKAYPVSFLNGREMVIDEIADVPIVVTW